MLRRARDERVEGPERFCRGIRCRHRTPCNVHELRPGLLDCRARAESGPATKRFPGYVPVSVNMLEIALP